MTRRDEDHEVMEKLRGIIDSKDITIFDKREVDAIRRMILTYESFESFGRLSSAVRGIVIWCGVMLAAYFAFTEWVLKFIRSNAGVQ
jgi:hypothetical protein